MSYQCIHVYAKNDPIWGDFTVFINYSLVVSILSHWFQDEMSDSSSTSFSSPKLLLSAWFCPFAQRAWIVANMLPEGKVIVINDKRSMIADTDDEGVHRDLSDGNHYDNIARYMLKGELLGERSVPTLIVPGGEDETGDAISIAKSLWLEGALCSELCSDIIEETARDWSNKIKPLFYDCLGNKNGNAAELFELLLSVLSSFGSCISGPFYHGANPSLVDVAIYPFIFRIICQRLFTIYRSKEISQSSLALLEFKACTNDNLSRVKNWIDSCNQVAAFRQTLPPDCDGSDNFFSPRLAELYHIYSLGVGLKGLSSGNIATIHDHNI